MAVKLLSQQLRLCIEKIYSSDLPRAVETAGYLSDALNIPVELKPEFRETDNGIFAGMPNETVDEKYPGVFWNTLEWNESYPNGESPRCFLNEFKMHGIILVRIF